MFITWTRSDYSWKTTKWQFWWRADTGSREVVDPGWLIASHPRPAVARAAGRGVAGLWVTQTFAHGAQRHNTTGLYRKIDCSNGNKFNSPFRASHRANRTHHINNVNIVDLSHDRRLQAKTCGNFALTHMSILISLEMN